MNSMNSGRIGMPAQTQQAAQASQSEQADEAGEAQKKGKVANGAQSQQVSSSASFAKQDANSVARSGGIVRPRGTKDGKAKDAKNILKSMSKKKQDDAESVQDQMGKSLSSEEEGLFDTSSGKGKMDELVDELLSASSFDIAEQVSILEGVKERGVSESVQTVLDQKIEEMLDSSLTAKISLATSELLRGIDKTAFATGTSLREDINTMLSYDNQGEFLSALENKYGSEKMVSDFPSICSQLNSVFSLAMSVLGTCSIPEKGQMFSALTTVSSLQQMAHIHSKAADLVASASKRHSI